MEINSQNFTVAVIPPGGLISGDRVAVSPRAAAGARSGLLTVFPGEPVERSRPVHLLGLEQVPEGVLAVGEQLAAVLDMLPADRVAWQLRTERITHLQAAELTLEVTVEHQLDDIVEQLNRSDELAGCLLWLSGARASETLFLEIGGKPFRVRDLAPAPPGDNTVLEITPQTSLKVFAPGYKSGIDVVILADCSGSMSIEDLTDYVDVVPDSGGWNVFRRATQSGVRHIKRTEALHRALNKLLETRLRVSGRMSRMALVSFTTDCEVRFPRGGGMAEIDENASPSIIQEFRDAINLLRAENKATDIGQAIYHAAELLHRHGRPGNDRLIVLISDGANWHPKGQDDVGEVLQATDEPVSLMEHLHQQMKIHLHAIGISTRDIFMNFFRRNYAGQTPNEASIPNHELLEQLVMVGGGDPTQTGDTNVLQHYLTGLGAGVTRHVKNPRAAATPPLQPHEIAALAEAVKPAARRSTSGDVRNELLGLKEEIRKFHEDCNGYMSAAVFRPMFAQSPKLLDAYERYMVTEAQNVEDFTLFINNINQCFCESVDKKIRKRELKGEPPPIPSVASILHEKLRAVSLLRNYYVHDKELELSGDGGGTSDGRRDHRKLVEVLQSLVGVGYIEDDDAFLWSQLQRAVLARLRDALRESRDEFKRAGQSPPAGADGDDASQVVWKW